jgi:glycosyltransferase involved in cell wall biosynthesis
MVTTFYPPYSFGGDGIFVQRLSRELAARGHTVDVVHCIDAYQGMAGPPVSETAAEPPGLTVHGLRSGTGRLWPLAMHQTGGPSFHAGAVRRILDQPFDVIHYHNVSLMGGPDVLTYGRALKLYTMHEYWLVCPTHVLYRFQREPCERPTCLSCTLAHKRPPQFWRYTTKMASAAKHVHWFLALSEFSIQAHRRRGFDRPMKLLPPFAPLPEPSEQSEKAPERPYFLFVGRLEKLKGLQTLIPQFQASIDADLWIAGAGGQEEELRRMAAGNPRVRFLGHVTEPLLSRLYRQAIALVVPSLCFEVFPLVLLEAFRQKTPVIVRHIGGMAEIAEASGGGIAYADEAALAAALRRLMNEPRVRDEMGNRGFDAYSRHWTPEAHLERYLSLIDECREAEL